MNELDKAQAVVELAYFIGRALGDIGKGINATLKYGYVPPQVNAEDAKEIMDAVNNATKIFSNNKNEKNLCDALTELAKAYFDYCDKRRW